MSTETGIVGEARRGENWTEIYADKNVFWQLDHPNPILVDNMENLTGGHKRRFFQPLAGKSLDVAYLLSQGHEVFTVDGAANAIEETNAENNFGLKFNKEESVYSTDDKKLQFFCGDFRTCPIEKFGPFDCIWDRAAFTAIDYEMRPAYAKMMERGLRAKDGGKKYHDFRYLLEVVDYDRSKFDGAPRAVSRQEVEELFGEWANIEVVEGGKFHPDVERVVLKVADIDPVIQVLYLLTPKYM